MHRPTVVLDLFLLSSGHPRPLSALNHLSIDQTTSAKSNQAGLLRTRKAFGTPELLGTTVRQCILLFVLLCFVFLPAFQPSLFKQRRAVGEIDDVVISRRRPHGA